MRLISHVAIGVRDLERSLYFYRDLLGMEVIRDEIFEPPPIDGLYADKTISRRRREVFLRWQGNKDLDNVFLVLSQPDDLASNDPLSFEHVGIHHVGFWVDDLMERVEKLRSAGWEIISVQESPGDVYGEDKETRLLNCFVKDPDGTLIQFDQRLGKK